MKHFLWVLLCLTLPWLVLLLHDNPGGAVVALVLQATGIGWIPASIWALRVTKEAEKSKKTKTHKKENATE